MNRETLSSLASQLVLVAIVVLTIVVAAAPRLR